MNDIQLTSQEHLVLSHLQRYPFKTVTNLGHELGYSISNISTIFKTVGLKGGIEESSRVLGALYAIGWIKPYPVDFRNCNLLKSYEPILDHWVKYPYHSLVITANHLSLSQSTITKYTQYIYDSFNIFSDDQSTLRLRLYASLGWYIPKALPEPAFDRNPYTLGAK